MKQKLLSQWDSNKMKAADLRVGKYSFPTWPTVRQHDAMQEMKQKATLILKQMCY